MDFFVGALIFVVIAGLMEVANAHGKVPVPAGCASAVVAFMLALSLVVRFAIDHVSVAVR